MTVEQALRELLWALENCDVDDLIVTVCISNAEEALAGVG